MGPVNEGQSLLSRIDEKVDRVSESIMLLRSDVTYLRKRDEEIRIEVDKLRDFALQTAEQVSMRMLQLERNAIAAEGLEKRARDVERALNDLRGFRERVTGWLAAAVFFGGVVVFVLEKLTLFGR